MIKKIFIVCLTLCIVSLSACGKTEKAITIERTSGMPIKLNLERKYNTIKLSGVIQKDNGLYFANTLEDFIDCYNNYYYRDEGEIYIKPYSEWYSYVQYFGRYKGDMHYEFKADKKIWTLPTITVYTPQDETIMKELTVDFDDHSYTEKMYKQYEEMCFYTLKAFFPDMNEKELTKLYKKLNKKAYANIFRNVQGFHSDNPPSDLYYRDEAGVYPYFAYGESVRICIIPVTNKVIKSYKKRGVKIHKL
ncbi:hypothetical protein D7V86_12940 [bacterium D16-51]|nr:hypothetical protein D7V96_05995 [bacterium D16-59]RKI59407.1 hypothetical protein D7V86_12940 [bacterium D16-51]